MVKSKSKRLTILGEAEQAALYQSPDVDKQQRLEYLTLTLKEENIMRSRSHLAAQIHCAIQIGYFKAKLILPTLKLSHANIQYYA